MTLAEYLQQQAIAYSKSPVTTALAKQLVEWADMVDGLAKAPVQVQWQDSLYNAVIVSAYEGDGEYSPWSADNEKPNPWREALIDACVIDCIGWNEFNPRESLRNLIKTELAMYTDTRIGQPPHGWKWMPLEVTEEMLAAVEEKGGPQARAYAYAAWDDLVNSAPIPDKYQITDGQVAGLLKKMIAPKVMAGEQLGPQDWFNFAKACRALVPLALAPNNDLTNQEPAL